MPRVQTCTRGCQTKKIIDKPMMLKLLQINVGVRREAQDLVLATALYWNSDVLILSEGVGRLIRGRIRQSSNRDSQRSTAKQSRSHGKRVSMGRNPRQKNIQLLLDADLPNSRVLGFPTTTRIEY